MTEARLIMSNKRQPYLSKPGPLEGTAPPRYQPPPQVTSGTGILKHYPAQSVPPPSFAAPVGKDGKTFPIAPLLNGDSNKPHYPVPPQYPAPPAVIQLPTAQRRPSLGLPQRLSDEELMRLGPVEMLKFVRKAESDAARVSSEQGQTNRETARRLQNYANEVRALKESNQRLSDDNQELRDLCCFLDDDRQKGRKLAREWQRFGRYTASVMRQEVSAYQNKLRELENKQQELIKDNLELKELCLYLDEERSQIATCPACGSGLRPGTRDDGDGSSSSTNADEPPLPSQFTSTNPRRERLLEESIQRQRTVFNDQMMHYVRGLEQRVKQLEEEKQHLQQKLCPTGESLDSSGLHSNGSWETDCGGRPEAVVQALQVLEVREQLERVHDNGVRIPEPELDMAAADLDDGEKALVREMCNVVWRKLEEGPAQRR